MPIRLLLFTLLLITTLSTAQAQQQLDPFELGVRLGWNIASLYDVDTEEIYELKSGLAIGGLAKFRFSRWIALQPEFLYSQQGALGGSNYDFTKIKNHYLIIPALIKLYPTQRLNFQIGPQFGILIASHIDGIDSRSIFTPAELALATGLEYDFNKGLLLTLRYNYSLTNVYDDNTSPATIANVLFLLSAGWRF